MIRSILLFLMFFAVFFVGIKVVVKMKLGEIWSLTKLISYSMLCSLLSVSVLSLIVVLF